MAQNRCTEASDSPPPTEDHSLLIKPINVGLSGAHHVLQSIRNGTAEVRDLLLNECDLIYECRMCKSLHRSLANFLAHKRVYCTLHCCESMMLFSQHDIENETVIVQPESPDSGTAVNDEATDEPDGTVDADEGKDVQKEVLPSPAKIFQASDAKVKTKQKNALVARDDADKDDFHAKCARHLANRNAGRSQVTIKLEQIEESSVAVLQSVLPAVVEAAVKPADPVVVDRPSPAVSVPPVVAEKPNSVKTSQRQKTPPASVASSSDSGGAKTYACCKCGSRFSSMKSMSFHVKTIHAKRRVYFHCPYCKSRFSQVYGVNRHMMSVHKKSKEQVGRLRSKIQKSALLRQPADKDSDSELNNNHSKGSESKSPAQSSPVRLTKSLDVHRCPLCCKTFADRRTLDAHARKCRSPDKDRHQPRSRNAVCGAKPKISDRPKRAVKKKDAGDFVDSSRLGVVANAVVTKGDHVTKAPPMVEKKILEIIDAEKLTCIHCNKTFMNVSNLRRHAAAHIGWNRFKCKHCDYQSYSRSDCRSHVKRKHITKRKLHKQLDSFVVDLPAEEVEKGVANGDFKPDKVAARAEPDLPRRASDGWSSCEEPETIKAAPEAAVSVKRPNAQPASFNISTRSSPRTFDTSPYRRSDPESALVTRSGSYPKPDCRRREMLPDREYQKVLRTKVIQLKPPPGSLVAERGDRGSEEPDSPTKDNNCCIGLFSNYDDHNYSVEVKFDAPPEQQDAMDTEEPRD